MSNQIPRIAEPRDLPRLRQHLLEQWEPGGGLSLAIEAHWEALRRAGHAATVGEPAGRRPEYLWNLRVLSQSALWWVNGEMCDLLAAAEGSLPADTLLMPELVPQTSGLVVFAKSLRGIDSAGHKDPVTVDAISWGPVEIMDMRHGSPETFHALGIASYRRLNFDDGLGERDMMLMVETGAHDFEGMEASLRVRGLRRGDSWLLHGEVWAPLGRADWIMGREVLDRHEGIDSDQAHASMVEDRKRLATLWLLASQPGIASVRQEHGDRAHQRREKRAGREPQPITIVTLPKARAARSEEPSVPTGRHLTVRFFVEGFWRNQPYGPERAYRRPTWVHAHWRGPADAPVVVRDKVRVVRSLTDEELRPGE